MRLIADLVEFQSRNKRCGEAKTSMYSAVLALEMWRCVRAAGLRGGFKDIR